MERLDGEVDQGILVLVVACELVGVSFVENDDVRRGVVVNFEQIPQFPLGVAGQEGIVRWITSERGLLRQHSSKLSD